MVRTDPAFNNFVGARDALKAYEASHTGQTKEQRLSDPEYLALSRTFKFADKTAADAQFSTNG